MAGYRTHGVQSWTSPPRQSGGSTGRRAEYRRTESALTANHAMVTTQDTSRYLRHHQIQCSSTVIVCVTSSVLVMHPTLRTNQAFDGFATYRRVHPSTTSAEGDAQHQSMAGYPTPPT